jgi:zinc finger HIT domain-containing protein 3
VLVLEFLERCCTSYSVGTTVSAPEEMSKCGVCHEALSKYRCPTCRVVRYCSVACYQVHKKDKCVQPSAEKKAGRSSVLKKRKQAPGVDLGEGEEEKLTEDAYARIISDEKFKKYFLDRRFQKVVKDIDSAPNRRMKLQQYIDNDFFFSNIVDEMLVLLDVASKNEKGHLVIDS